jgi:Domain of unknown function (DUF5668)
LNRYLLIRRLRGPAFLLLVGVLALLAQAHILSWERSWPLYLILAGVLLLAERAALAAEDYPPPPYPAAPYPNTNPNPPAGGPAEPVSSIVPSHPHDFGDQSKGGPQ